MRGTPGWLILHIVAILFTFWLGGLVRFVP
jgi:hypothetical protein